MRSTILATLALALAAPAFAQAPPRHVIAVTLDPEAGTLKGSDELTLPWSRALAVSVHPDLEVSATCNGKTLKTMRTEGGKLSLKIPSSCRDQDGNATVSFALSGRIVDEIKDEPSLHFVTGDRTSGLISKDGAFLAGNTGWYPETDSVALFDATITVPQGWSVISQGDAHDPTDADGGARAFRYSSSIPTDGLALSAGPYESTSADAGGIRVTAWFLHDDRELAPLFLDAAKAEIPRLIDLLGPYPGTRFDIVENFFTTGYGFPNYTLLGKDVIRMGPRALRPGYLDHEIAHAWLGNGVSVDLSGGNWCEGLTSYVTNYLNTAKDGEQAALDARRKVSQRYSVDVPKDKDFAPAKFTEKSDDVGASIGYGKVSMVFHLLAQELGDAPFRTGLKDFVTSNQGRRASWKDVEASFEKASGKDLSAFFAQWIGRAGLPELKLDDVKQVLAYGKLLRGDIVQLGEPYDLDLDVRVTTIHGQQITMTFPCSGARTALEVGLPEDAAKVELDPDFHVPRRIAPRDLPPSLSRTLAGRPLLVLHGNPVPEAATDAEIKRHDQLVELAKLAAGDDGKVMPAQDATEEEMRTSSVLLLGDMSENGWVRERAKNFEDASGVDVRTPQSFRAGDRRWRAGDASILASCPNPDDPSRTITVWAPNWYEALDSGRMIFYYGWDTWAAIQGGRAQERGTVWPESSATSVVLRAPEPPATAPGRMRATIATLTAPILEGRDSGQRSGMAGIALVDELQAAGVEPYSQLADWNEPFAFVIRDLPGSPQLAWTPKGAERTSFVPVVPATEWLPSGDKATVAAQSGVPEKSGRIPWKTFIPRGLVSTGPSTPQFAGLDFTDAAAVVVDDGHPDGAAARVRAWVEEARRRNAEALVVLRPDAPWPGVPELVHAASLRDPAKREKLDAIAQVQGRRALLRISTGERARAAETEPPLKFPVFFGGRELLDAVKAQGGLARGARSFDDASADLRLSFTLEQVDDWNLIGRVPGTSGAEQPAVLLSAHRDGLGELADGTFQQGAADNAAGVAVVVEVARRLAAKPAELPVIVVITSGEEWGLQGSRALAAEWAGSRPDLKAVVNVDSVGHEGEAFHVVGRSRQPKLAAILEADATAAGLQPGKDIDQYADRDGSDHWPWVAKGVPSVDVFQADYKLINGPQDTADKLDDDTLERVADSLEASIRKLATSANSIK